MVTPLPLKLALLGLVLVLLPVGIVDGRALLQVERAVLERSSGPIVCEGRVDGLGVEAGFVEEVASAGGEGGKRREGVELSKRGRKKGDEMGDGRENEGSEPDGSNLDAASSGREVGSVSAKSDQRESKPTSSHSQSRSAFCPRE